MSELKEKILKKSGLSEKELKKKIEEKLKKFSGMLNEEAVLFLVAREYKINIQENYSKISELKKGKRINLKAEIAAVYPERQFYRNGENGRVKNVLLKDETGKAFLVLWDNETKKINERDIGKEIELKEFIVSEYNSRIQLRKGFNGSLELKEKLNTIKKINEIKENEVNVSIKGRILKSFPLKEFESKGRKGMLKRIELIDDTGTINVLLWNEKAKTELSEGQGIELKAFNSRKGFNGVELHSSFNSEITETTKLKELKELCINFFERRELNEKEKGKRILIKGKIKELGITRMLFSVCTECGKKVEEEGGKFFCVKCGQILKPEKKMVLSFSLENNAKEMKTMAYGKEAEKIIEKTKEEIQMKLNEINTQELIRELNEKIKGKELVFLAKEKSNSFTGESELVLEKLL
jgi:replication factor A1